MYFTQEQIESAKKAFAAALPVGADTQRRLRSIAFHLEIAIDIANARNDELMVAIGNEFIKRHGPPPAYGWGTVGLPVYLSPELNDALVKIATQHHVPVSEFDFLLSFSRKYIKNSLYKTEIVSDRMVENSFRNTQAAEVVLGYLCDISKDSADQITRDLMNLKNRTQVMVLTWAKHLSWFSNDRNREKLRAASFYSGKQIPDATEELVAMISQRMPKIVLMPTIQDYDDIEIFFHRVDFPSPFKVFVYEKIRDLYNTRSSRAENKKKRKNCSFVLSPEAKLLIDTLAKENNVKGKGSALLELIFQNHNKEDLQRLLNKRNYFIPR